MLTTENVAFKILLHGQITEEIKLWAIGVVSNKSVNKHGLNQLQVETLANQTTNGTFNRITMIKFVREWLGCSIKDARDIVWDLFPPKE